MAIEPVVAEYTREARAYDARWARYVRASIEQMLAQLDPHGVDSLLDVGCGTGLLLAEVHARWPPIKLSGVDATGAMLAIARSRLGNAAQLHQARAERLPFASAAFDALLSGSVLHFLPDARATLQEWLRVTRPGARFVITDWCADDLLIRLRVRYLRWRGRATGQVYRTQELAALLRAAGLQDVTLKRYRIGVTWGMMIATGRKPATSS